MQEETAESLYRQGQHPSLFRKEFPLVMVYGTLAGEISDVGFHYLTHDRERQNDALSRDTTQWLETSIRRSPKLHQFYQPHLTTHF